MRFYFFGEIIVVTLLVSLLGCGASHRGTNPDGKCGSGIDYQGRTFDLDASFKQFGLKAGSSNQVMREVSDTMKIYFDEAANMCSVYKQGKISAVEYLELRSSLSSRFAALVSMTKENPPEQVSPEEEPIYLETLSLMKKASDIPVEMSFSVVSEGKSLKSGDALKSGSSFQIRVDVPHTAYVYVVLIDSSDNIYRLYPTELTGTENPIKGTKEISGLTLDNNPGTERILLFVQKEPSKAIESSLPEVSLEGQAAAKPVKTVTRGVFVRKRLQEQSSDNIGKIVSQFGMVTAEFLIEHQ